MGIIAIYGALAALVGGLIWRSKSAARRRRARYDAPFSEAWRAIIAKNVPLVQKLPEKLRLELESRVNVFVAEKNFEGCGGLEITDEIKVTIAAQACVLLLNRRADYYPKLDSILVYPSGYRTEGMEAHLGGGIVVRGEQHRLGESAHGGYVVLSWDEVLGNASEFDGHNLVLHEFAHQLDQADGRADGVPQLPARSSYISWARVMSEEFAKFNNVLDQGASTFLNPYGATNAAEFFAVLTEYFFERPNALSRQHPDLYKQLRHFYNLDPREWIEF